MPQKPQLLSPRCLSLPPVCETDLLKEGRTPERGIRGTRPHTATLERAIGEPSQWSSSSRTATTNSIRPSETCEMHAILLDALAANPALATERMRGRAAAAGNVADELEAVVARRASKLH